MSTRPPPPSEENGNERAAADAADATRPHRPRWLVVALLVAMVLGTTSWWDGCARLEMYHSESSQAAARIHATIEDEAARARAEAAFVDMLDVYGATRNRTVGLASATFVLGAALLAFAWQGLGGRRGSRRMLVQVVSVQAVVAIASYVFLRDVRAAERRWEHANLAPQTEAFPPEWRARAAAIEDFKQRLQAPLGLALRTLSSAFVVLALTRPRSRAFFEGDATPSER